MTTESDNPYSDHYVNTKKIFVPGGWYWAGRKWTERQSKNPDLPGWLRIAHYCYAHVRPDNHCPVPRGELARFVGKDDRETRRDIQKAVRNGYLAEGSCSRCLIAPSEIGYKNRPTRSSECGLH